MPEKRQCEHLNIVRATREMTEADFRVENDRIRGAASVRVLAAVYNALKSGKVTEPSLLTFLAGGDTGSNLAPGAEAVALAPFLFDHFLPKKKKRSVTTSTYNTAVDVAKRLVKTIGEVHIHEIRPVHANQHKEARQALNKANISTRQDLNLLAQAMNYAVECGMVERNPLLPVRDLPRNDRSSIWPRLKDIPRMMRCLPRPVKALAYFQLLVGGRINESLAVTAHDIDWVKREIRIPNSKRRRKNPRAMKRFRTIKIDDVGTRLEWLLKKIIKPDPVSGHLFPGRYPGTHMTSNSADRLFLQGIRKAGLDHLVPPGIAESGGHPNLIIHDLRGGFANHGAIAGWSFQKLRSYMGQIDAQSIQSYLDEADGSTPAESLFVHPPLRVRREQKRALLAEPARTPVSANQSGSLFLN